jgi:hypothetical protein
MIFNLTLAEYHYDGLTSDKGVVHPGDHFNQHKMWHIGKELSHRFVDIHGVKTEAELKKKITAEKARRKKVEEKFLASKKAVGVKTTLTLELYVKSEFPKYHTRLIDDLHVLRDYVDYSIRDLCSKQMVFERWSYSAVQLRFDIIQQLVYIETYMHSDRAWGGSAKSHVFRTEIPLSEGLHSLYRKQLETYATIVATNEHKKRFEEQKRREIADIKKNALYSVSADIRAKELKAQREKERA